jgi:hypothetical protein
MVVLTVRMAHTTHINIRGRAVVVTTVCTNLNLLAVCHRLIDEDEVKKWDVVNSSSSSSNNNNNNNSNPINTINTMKTTIVMEEDREGKEASQVRVLIRIQMWMIANHLLIGCPVGVLVAEVVKGLGARIIIRTVRIIQYIHIMGIQINHHFMVGMGVGELTNRSIATN